MNLMMKKTAVFVLITSVACGLSGVVATAGAEPPAPTQSDRNGPGYEPFVLLKPHEGDKVLDVQRITTGEVKYVVRDDKLQRYFLYFRSDKPLAKDNWYDMTLDEYLYVIEGAVRITFLPKGPELNIEAGGSAFLPSGTRVNVTLTKLPYQEVATMVKPEK
jgi:mannose-6-phosphate isomerase-like protein (cupin superfamily)